MSEWPYREAIVSGYEGKGCPGHEGMKPTRKLAFPFKATTLIPRHRVPMSFLKTNGWMLEMCDGGRGIGLDCPGDHRTDLKTELARVAVLSAIAPSVHKDCWLVADGQRRNCCAILRYAIVISVC